MVAALPSDRAGPAPARPLRVAVLLLPGSYVSPAMVPVDVFHAAGRLWNRLQGEPAAPRFEVQVASVDGRPVDVLGAVRVAPPLALHEVKDPDLVLVPNADLESNPFDRRILDWLCERYQAGTALGGICTGSTYLAEAGLLEDRLATTHWAFADAMRMRYPNVRWQPDRMVTEDSGLFCSGGVYAAMDLSLYLVERFAGREVALQCARALLLPMPRKHQGVYAAPVLPRPHGDDRVREMEEYLRSHFNEALTAETLACRAHMSTRNFIRRFNDATGQMPGAYVQALRVAAAKALLEDGCDSIQRICTRVGYQDPAHFRDLFKRHTGMTPLQYRERFALADLAGAGTGPLRLSSPTIRAARR
jgi:transcriptional regulator GlxA family with amidase domain